MKIKKAIEILKAHNNWRRGHIEEMCLTPKEIGEAIDTVVKELEKPLPTDDEIIERANEAYHGDEIVPHFQRVGFTFGAIWMRDLIRKGEAK